MSVIYGYLSASKNMYKIDLNYVNINASNFEIFEIKEIYIILNPEFKKYVGCKYIDLDSTDNKIKFDMTKIKDYFRVIKNDKENEYLLKYESENYRDNQTYINIISCINDTIKIFLYCHGTIKLDIYNDLKIRKLFLQKYNNQIEANNKKINNSNKNVYLLEEITNNYYIINELYNSELSSKYNKIIFDESDIKLLLGNDIQCGNTFKNLIIFDNTNENIIKISPKYYDEFYNIYIENYIPSMYHYLILYYENIELGIKILIIVADKYEISIIKIYKKTNIINNYSINVKGNIDNFINKINENIKKNNSDIKCTKLNL